MLQIGPWYVIFTFYICIYITYVCASVFYYLSSKKAPLEGKGGVCFVHSHFSSAYALVDAKKNICGVKRWENEWRYTIYTSCLVQGLTHSKSPRKVSRFSHCLLRHGLVWPSRHVGLTSTDPTSHLPNTQNDMTCILVRYFLSARGLDCAGSFSTCNRNSLLLASEPGLAGGAGGREEAVLWLPGPALWRLPPPWSEPWQEGWAVGSGRGSLLCPLYTVTIFSYFTLY